jgi:hypothetical protein
MPRSRFEACDDTLNDEENENKNIYTTISRNDRSESDDMTQTRNSALSYVFL